MDPTVLPGDRVLATPLAFGPLTPFGKIPGIARPRRGDLVIAEPGYAIRIEGLKLVADAIVRFATLQRISIARDSQEPALSGPLLKRVIALPGDSIKMEDFVFMVKPAGELHYLTEFELSRRRYDISSSSLPVGWIEGMPGSGSMPERVLGKDECFLAGDARSASSDSRDWGAVKLDRLRSLVFLRYWPLRRFGLP
jgi:signal peptidase I